MKYRSRVVAPVHVVEEVGGMRRRLLIEQLEREVQRRTSELRQTVSRLEEAESAIRRSHEITVHRLAMAAEFRDNSSARHIERMSL